MRERLLKLAIALTALPLFAALPAAWSSPLVGPGDPLLRHDLQLLDDGGHVDIPLSAWPIAVVDIARAVDAIDPATLEDAEVAALARIRGALQAAMRINRVEMDFAGAAAGNPRIIRGFEDTPRAEGRLRSAIRWTGNHVAVHAVASVVANPDDGDEFRPDGSYVATALGNWLLSAGWQERWWGPGRDGSLILSTNARPLPALSLQRMQSRPFEYRWLRWIGPWTLTTFFGLFDDDRAVNDAQLFGVRGTFRPLRSLEIGISRTAMWCGDGRPCSGSTFVDLLLGRDNRGVNVTAEDEPGNQLGGIDIRWRLPRGVPAALYLQWIGEDGRDGGPAIGSWLRQVGVEHWGSVGALRHRSYAEVAETSCRRGGLGSAGNNPDCAYEHGIYTTGYRYKGRPLGHGIDGDGLSYSIGSTLVQSAGHRWNASLRFAEINRIGAASTTHTLSATRGEQLDLLVTHGRQIAFGSITAGLGWRRVERNDGSNVDEDVLAFVEWRSD